MDQTEAYNGRKQNNTNCWFTERIPNKGQSGLSSIWIVKWTDAEAKWNQQDRTGIHYDFLNSEMKGYDYGGTYLSIHNHRK